MKVGLILYFLAVGMFCLPSHAHAYIDPGTGSLILQALAAAAITGMAFVRGIREKIISLFRSRKDRKKKNDA